MVQSQSLICVKYASMDVCHQASDRNKKRECVLGAITYNQWLSIRCGLNQGVFHVLDCGRLSNLFYTWSHCCDRWDTLHSINSKWTKPHQRQQNYSMNQSPIFTLFLPCALIIGNEEKTWANDKNLRILLLFILFDEFASAIQCSLNSDMNVSKRN